MALAEAYVEILADTDRFEPDLEAKLRRSGASAGKAFSRAFKAEVAKTKIRTPEATVSAEKAGGTAGRAFARDLKRQVAKTKIAVPEAKASGEKAGATAGRAFAKSLKDKVADTKLRLPEAKTSAEKAGATSGRAFARALKAVVKDMNLNMPEAKASASRAGVTAGNAFVRAFKATVQLMKLKFPEVNASAAIAGMRAGARFSRAFKIAVAATKIKIPDADRAGTQAGGKAGKNWSKAFSAAAKKSSGKAGGGIFGALAGQMVGGAKGGAVLAVAKVILIGGLVAAATQAAAEISKVIGILAALPVAAAGAATAITALVIGLKGVGDAISSGWSGDMEEFTKSLERLAPAAQSVAKEIVALKGPMDALKKSVQQGLFDPMIGSFEKLAQVQKGDLQNRTPLEAYSNGLHKVAEGMGQLTAEMVGFLSTTDAMTAFDKLSQSLSDMFKNMGPGVTDFFSGLAKAIEKTSGKLSEFGNWISDISGRFGDWLKESAENGKLTEWIDSAVETFQKLWDIISNLGAAIAAMFGNMTVGEDGGGFLDYLVEKTQEFKEFMQSEDGQRFAENVKNSAMNMIKMIMSTISFIMQLVANIQLAKDTFMNFVNSIVNLPQTIGMALWESRDQIRAFIEGSLTWLRDKFNEVKTSIGAAVDDINLKIFGFVQRAREKFDEFLLKLGRIHIDIAQKFRDAGNWLREAGGKIIDGLVSGIRSGIGRIRSVMGSVTSVIRGFLPFSPAKEGPLSGSGNPENSGRKIGSMLATGIQSQRGTVASAMRSLVSTAPTTAPPITAATGGVRSNPYRLGLGSDRNQNTTVTNHRTTTVNAPITVRSASADPGRVARRAADRLARMATV